MFDKIKRILRKAKVGDTYKITTQLYDEYGCYTGVSYDNIVTVIEMPSEKGLKKTFTTGDRSFFFNCNQDIDIYFLSKTYSELIKLN